MKRFLLFAGENYYPSGGMEDFINSFDSEQEAKDWYNKNQIAAKSNPDLEEYEWLHIWDCTESKIIYENQVS
jgi:hypothetical protein